VGAEHAETDGERLSLGRIEEAARCIDPVFLGSPQFEAEALGDELGLRLVCKVETANPIRSFKGRGTDYLLHRLGGVAGRRTVSRTFVDHRSGPCGHPSNNAEQEILAVSQTSDVLQGDVEAARQRLLGQPSYVRREHNVVQRQERVVGRRGLPGQHVEAGGQQPPARKSFDQRCLLDEPAARGVDQDGARLHARQGRPVDEPLCLRC
jgi:hypothetical protein